MMVDCIKCGRRRSEKYMQQAVFRDFMGDEKIPGIYKCASSQSCKQARKACREGNHRVVDHRHTDRWYDGQPGTYCMYNTGMGNPCGCEKYNK